MYIKLKHTQPRGWHIKIGDVGRKYQSTSMSEEIGILTSVYSSPYIYIYGLRHDPNCRPDRHVLNVLTTSIRCQGREEEVKGYFAFCTDIHKVNITIMRS